MEYITIHQWLEVKKETRAKLRQIFFIPSTGMVEVVTDEFGKSSVKQDGHTNVDLQVITVEKLVDYLGSAAINETIFDLWKRAIEKVENPLVEIPAIEVTKEQVAKVEDGKVMNTADNQLKCDKCPYQTGNKRALTAHKTFKHNRVKVA